MIDNDELNSEHKMALEFYLSKLPQYKDALETQINASSVEVDSSPYYCILKFNIQASSYPIIEEWPWFGKAITVCHKYNDIPSVFILYIENGRICEFEYFQVDSSRVDVPAMCDPDADIVIDVRSE